MKLLEKKHGITFRKRVGLSKKLNSKEVTIGLIRKDSISATTANLMINHSKLSGQSESFLIDLTLSQCYCSSTMKFGTHTSIAGGYDKAPERAHSVGADTFQMFSRSPRGGKTNTDPDKEARFKAECDKYSFNTRYVHTPYYINLASLKPKIKHGSIEVLKEEIDFATKVDITHIVTHIGSAKDQDREQALETTVKSLNKVADGSKEPNRLLLEISGGAGDLIGGTFEELKFLLDGEPRLGGVCLDTCHLFVSGYDLRTKKNVNETIKQFDTIVGLDKLKYIHLNDSKGEHASNLDRHENLGDGNIGNAGLDAFINHPKLQEIDFVLETPVKDDDGWRDNLARARKLWKNTD